MLPPLAPNKKIGSSKGLVAPMMKKNKAKNTTVAPSPSMMSNRSKNSMTEALFHYNPEVGNEFHPPF
jgi:hypothetical protein